MGESADNRKVYCPHCQKDVTVTITRGAARDGQANLGDHDDLVCLDFGEGCDGPTCPLSRHRPVVMGVRLARSGLRSTWKTVRAQCEGCGQVSDLVIVDSEHAFCALCGTTNTWMVIELDQEGNVVVTGRTGT